MRTIIVSGRIVADAQKLSTASGIEYLSFRLANNEFSAEKDSDGNPITYWYRVISFDRRLINLGQYLTKGKPINVTGRYSDRIYQNKQGQCDISREIVASIIDFQESNRHESSGAVTNTTTPTQVKPQPIVSNSGDDDLPF